MPKAEDTWVLRDGTPAGAPRNVLWVVLIESKDFAKISQDWGSNVESWINHVKSKKIQEQVQQLENSEAHNGSGQSGE